jgi:acylphosphatase
MTVLEAKVKGTVQGVGFRYFVQRRAVALGLAGYARNLADGDVEVIAEGGREQLEALLGDLNLGPAMSSVESIRVVWSETGQPHFSGFNIRY